jgi:predicted metal-dependent hydrolase
VPAIHGATRLGCFASRWRFGRDTGRFAALPYRGAVDILKYLGGYPEHVQAQVRELAAQGRLGERLHDRYGEAHAVRNDKALQQYTVAMKDRFLRQSGPLHKVIYDDKLQVVRQALGTHTAVSRVQGSRLKARREIRIASVFRDAPAEFLKMIVVHELAHLKEYEHNKAFYQLCTHMAPDYHQLEFDLRLYLTLLESEKASASEPVLGSGS